MTQSKHNSFLSEEMKDSKRQFTGFVNVWTHQSKTLPKLQLDTVQKPNQSLN